MAARNVLLSASLQAKVSDFGLSRMLAFGSVENEEAYYRLSTSRPLPIRWMVRGGIGSVRRLER